MAVGYSLTNDHTVNIYIQVTLCRVMVHWEHPMVFPKTVQLRNNTDFKKIHWLMYSCKE